MTPSQAAYDAYGHLAHARRDWSIVELDARTNPPTRREHQRIQKVRVALETASATMWQLYQSRQRKVQR